MIHLDSSFIIDLLREQKRQPGTACAWLERHPGDALAMSVFVACELEAGAEFAAHPETERARIHGVVQTITTVCPDHRFAAAYATLLSNMRQRGRTIGTMDLLIATTAIVDGVALLTGNRKHFDAVPDLRVLTHR